MQLEVRQIYNNNSALVRIGVGKEAVVHGKGIGFGKRRGDTIDSKIATKILYLGDDHIKGEFSSLLKDIPIDIVVTVFSIIDHARAKYHLKLLNYIYVTLSDHVFQMYKKLISGQYKVSVVPDISEQYPIEYQAANDALRLINRNLSVYFPKNEIKNLALHFINAQGEEAISESKDNLIISVNEVVQTIFAKHDISRNINNRNYFDRLMIHLQYLIERVQDGVLDSQELSPEIRRDFHKKYPNSFAIADEISRNLEVKLKFNLNENERLYFIIHIQRLIRENED